MMKRPDALYKTTIVIWTDWAPLHMEIDELAREAVMGDAFCAETDTEYVTDHTQFPVTEFFGTESPIE